MASLTMLPFNLRFCRLHSCPTRVSYGSAQLAPPLNKVNNSLRLSSSHYISGSHSLSPIKRCNINSLTHRLQPLIVFAAKGYKMKTHKVNLCLFDFVCELGFIFLFCVVNSWFLSLKAKFVSWRPQ